MQLVWWIGLALPAASLAVGAIAVVSRDPRRVGFFAGAIVTAVASLAAWLVLRVAITSTRATLELAFLQCAIVPMAIFLGAIVGMIVHWRKSRP